jgi:putative ATP-binding cassette transporter
MQRPDIVVMDEATAALDPSSQEQLMRLLLDRLPEATVVTVGHRPELEAFHSRKLVLAHHSEGARLARDESLRSPFRRTAQFLSRLLTREAT